MITKPTVLILGAGASMPFGFPSGEELVSRIFENLEGGHPTRDVLSHAIQALEPSRTIDNFHEALFYSGCLSIDAFLEYNSQFLEVGKMAIASVLVPLENEDKLFSTKLNWYKLLFKHLYTQLFEEFIENKFSILTYNYDRSLEQFLQGFINASCCRTISVVRKGGYDAS